VHQRKRIKSSNVCVRGISLDKKEVKDFDHFGDQENELGTNYYTPALCERDAVAIRKAADPDHERDHGKLPEIDERNGEKLNHAEHLQYESLGPVLEKLEGSGLILDKGFFEVQQEKREHAQ